MRRDHPRPRSDGESDECYLNNERVRTEAVFAEKVVGKARVLGTSTESTTEHTVSGVPACRLYRNVNVVRCKTCKSNAVKSKILTTLDSLTN